jgi:triacylglycerol lipase
MGMAGRVRLALAAIAAMLLALLAGPAAVSAAPAAERPAARSEPPPPPQANDRCRAGQDATPVVLVHGTFGDRFQMGVTLSRQLETAGHCVFALNYGDCNAAGRCGRARIQESARELRRFINRRVLDQSRSGEVSIVGHSQGGLMSRYYIRFLGGRRVVDDMVGLSPSNHGTDNPFAPSAGQLANCPACLQQHPYNSRFTRRVNRGDETIGNISYTQVQTRFDEVVLPYFSAYLAEDPGVPNTRRTRPQNGPNTTNFCLQDRFPGNPSEHNTIPQDQQAFRVVLNALERGNRPARPPATADSVCTALAFPRGS